MNSYTRVQGLQQDLYRFNGNEPLLLTDSQTVWVVQLGSFALFAITVASGLPQGQRRYLTSIGPGEAMFSIPPKQAQEQQQIIAVSLEPAEIVRVTRAEFNYLLTVKESSAVLMLERWIQQLSSALADICIPTYDILEPGSNFFSLEDGQIFSPEPGNVLWVRIQQGSAKWMGFEELIQQPSSAMLPFTTGMWLEAAENLVELEYYCTRDIQDTEILFEGLVELTSYFLQGIVLLQQQEVQQEFLKYEEKQRLNRQVMNETLEKLAGVIKQAKTAFFPAASPEADLEEALLIAAGAVGRALDITIRPPSDSEDWERVQDPLDAIARASQIRIRRIQLTDKWWKQDSGPMLGYTIEDQCPVALLPVSANRYEIFHPLKRKRTSVDAKSAATLATTGYVFYRPLPDKILTTLDLLSFAMRGHLKGFVSIFIIGVIVALLGMLVPQATAILIDHAIPDANRGLLLQIALGLTAATIGEALFQLTQGLTIMRLETFADTSTQAAVWDRLLKLKASFFREYSVGDLESRVQAISEVHQKLSSTVLKTLFGSLFSLLNLGLLFYYSASLALIATVIAFANVTITIIFGVLSLRKIRPLLELEGNLFGIMVQLINGVAKLRVAGAEARAFGYWGSQYSRQLKLMLSSQALEDNLLAINKFMPTLTSCILFWFAATSLQQSQLQGGLSTGTFLAFNAAFGIFISGATSLSTTVIDILEVVPLWKRVQPILTAEPEVNSNKADPGRLSGRVVVDHVIFRYRNDGPPTLNNVSLRAEPGEFIALVGTSGSGKSTLFRLLLGFDAPESGGIYYDGQDLSGLDISAVRRQLGVVLQNSRLMSASIFENIAGNTQVTMDEAWEAAYMAGFAEDIEAMPMGMHTVISEGGSNLSGGQRQRLLIAKALVLKPRILLFDEATSALDNKTQAIVSESLDRLNVTRIVIAHRLSTIRNADCIYVLHGGRVIQQGSFQQLANQEGLFAQLMARQRL
jgi:NHLM bacteriocin system ABC transporter ATP-binding protein